MYTGLENYKLYDQIIVITFNNFVFFEKQTIKNFQTQ